MKFAIALLLVLATVGCGAAGNSGNDLFRAINEPSYKFNVGADRYILRPVNKGWNALPDVFTKAFSNVYNNIDDIRQVGFNLLQGRFGDAMKDIARILINTSFGLYGLFDLAGAAGLKRSNESLEDVLGTWGVPPGPYIHLPLLGPRTTRGLFTSLSMSLNDPLRKHYGQAKFFDTGSFVELMDTRTDLIPFESFINAPNSYEVTRQLYMDYIEGQIKDKNNEVDEDDEFFEDF